MCTRTIQLLLEFLVQTIPTYFIVLTAICHLNCNGVRKKDPRFLPAEGWT